MPFLKKNWKWIAAGTVVLVIVLIAFLSFRVVSFISATTGGGRIANENGTPTPDAPATATVQARFNELFGTPTPLAGSASSPTGQTPSPQVNFNTSDVVQKIKKGEPISIMVLGYPGVTHEGQWLTDTILVMRYDPKTKTMLQFSIPRDLYVYAPTGGANNGRWMKINGILGYIMDWNKPTQDSLAAKYRWTDDTKKFDKGVNLVADTVQDILGFPIDYWATISFEGFRKFIDSMGGVEVDVERYFIDKKYPKNDNDKVDASYITVEFQAGKQLMNGETAIRYSRSRNSDTPLEGGDFARSRRQMRMIQAVKDKALRENLILKSLDYMNALQGNIRFSLEFGELTALANYFNSPEGKALATDIKFSSEVLTNTYVEDTTFPDWGYALIPKEGQGKYTEIHRWVQSVIANADIRREQVRVQGLNANGTSGLASKFTDFLMSQGFRIADAQDGDAHDFTEIVDYTMGAAPNTIARLKSYLGNLPNLKITQISPDKKPKSVSTDTNIQLYLGKDFKGTASNASGGVVVTPSAETQNTVANINRREGFKAA
ncbi:MAG: LCP family protein [Chloroflexi bacterium]|uniref:LCP family protein n=1 Tax=Candidatus Chlorohelix allophototropha TaxID=3003348 RepID=A0A8T7M099_9CHLR|nr:LCP family protein [Chloroflexota bacterium]